ncbi:unnamed protein product [Closterium sp. NIES-53]
MANPIVLAFDTVGHPLGLDFWLEGLHLYFHSVTRDDVSLFEHTSGSLQAPKAPAEPAADAGEEVRTKFRAAHIAYKRWMARDAAATLAVRLHLSFDQRANFRQVPSAHAMYSAVVRRYSPPPLAVLGCLVLPLTFLALSDLITVAIEGGRSGAGGSGGGGHQELEPSCVAACAPTSIVYAYPSTVLLCLVVPSASSGSTEGGDPTAADTATSRRSPRLETPPGFPSQTSLPPLQPVVADFGGPGVVGGGDAGGAGSRVSNLYSLFHAVVLRRLPSSPSPPHRALMSQHVSESSEHDRFYARESTAVHVISMACTLAFPYVLTFDAEGRTVDFDVWVDDLQIFLQCDSRDGVSLFDHTSVARYSSPATAALSRLMLPYLFPDLAAFATVADLITHLRTSDARYRAALPTEDHFLSLCPTELTINLLEKRLAAAEKSILARLQTLIAFCS